MTKFVKSNEAVVMGALYAGCDLYFGYPITPASEIAHGAAKWFPMLGRTFVQAECETASVNMMFGAAGAAEAIATVLALRDGIIPPTINLDCPDPECDLDYTPNVAVKSDITLGISESLGFGGHDACVAFRKYNG